MGEHRGRCRASGQRPRHRGARGVALVVRETGVEAGVEAELRPSRRERREREGRKTRRRARSRREEAAEDVRRGRRERRGPRRASGARVLAPGVKLVALGVLVARSVVDLASLCVEADATQTRRRARSRREDIGQDVRRGRRERRGPRRASRGASAGPRRKARGARGARREELGGPRLDLRRGRCHPNAA